MQRFDVVVIGAGLAGLHCAAELAARGLLVAIIDRQRQPGARVATTGIIVRKTLEDFRLPPHCLGPWVSDVVVHSPCGRMLPLRSPKPEFRVARMSALYDHLLARCIARGIQWMSSTAFRGCRLLEQGTAIEILRRGHSREIRARFVIGADGAKSAVAPALELDVNCEWIVGVEDVFAAAPLDAPAVFHCFLDPLIAPGYIGWVVNDGEEAHVGVGGYPQRFVARDALDRLKAQIVGRFHLRSAQFIERRAGRIPVGGVLRRIAGKRGALVGDAAGAPSPLTGGGIDACFRLSEAVAKAVHGYLNGGSDAALTELCGDRIRRRFFSRRLLRRAIASTTSPWLVEAAFTALAGPLRPLAHRVFFHRGSFPTIEMDRLEGRAGATATSGA